MAPNRKRIGITAPDGAWRRLGELLEAWRRTELGYRSRVRFAADRLPPTPQGNANVRLVSDIENSYRPDTYPAGTLREIAKAYGVAYESMLAVLRGEADELVPVPAAPVVPAPPAVPGEPPGSLPPFADPARIAAARPYYDQIRGRLELLRAQGVAEPSGRQLFPDAPADARDWDGVGARLDTDARVWLIAELRAGEDDRARSRPRAAGA